MRKLTRYLLSALTTVGLVLGFVTVGAIPAQAVVVDLNYAPIAFANPGQAAIGSGNPSVGFSYVYEDAATVGSQGIDAIVTLVNKTDTTLSVIDQGGTPSQSAPANNLNSSMDFPVSGGGSVTYQIDFVEANTNTPITLQNVAIAVWDIDLNQYAQFAGITSYKLASNTLLQTLTNTGGIPAGTFRFFDSTNSNSDASDQPNWVEVRYAEINTLQISLGATRLSGAFFSVKFAPELWSNAVTTTPAATSYTITYDGNTSDSGSVPAQTSGTGGQTVASNTGNLVKSGHYLAGWNTAANGSGATYLPGSTIIPVTNTTLYAMWVAGSQPTYTKSYDGNTSDSGTSPSSTTGFGTYPTSTNSGGLSKTGHTFGGWNTLANGTGTTYQPGSLINLNSNVTLYAIWTPIAQQTYTLTYNPNSSTSGTAPNATTGSGAVNTAPNSGFLTRPGFTFAGWNTQPDGSGTTYQPGAQINLTGNVTLYAMWTPSGANTLAATGSSFHAGSAAVLVLILSGLAMVLLSRRFLFR